MFTVKGHAGEVSFDGHAVSIARKGFLARATVGKGEKRIPVTSITAVQWKPAGGLMNGYIQFTIAGGVETRSLFGRQTIDAAKDENAMVFTKKQMPEFERLRTAIEQAMAAARSGAAPQQQASVADELAKLGELYRQGLLTEAEFQSQKTHLLAR